MTIQNPKRLIDTGVTGVEGTGDTLNAGGIKLNADLNSVYNVFGDYRLYKTDTAQGDQIMTLHARGYPQKHTRAYYAGGENPSGNPVEHGSFHDISVTRGGIADLTLNLPTGYGHQGEYIEIINTDGSVGFGAGKEFIIRTSGAGDTISGFGTSMKIQKPYFRIVLWVQNSAATGSTWMYRMESLYGSEETAYSAKISTLAPGNNRTIQLFNKSLYSTIKQLVFVTQQGSNVNQECAEVLMLVNNTNNNDNQVYYTEYARLRTDAPGNPAEDLLYDITYFINNGVVNATVTNRSSVAIDVTFKSVSAIGGFTQ